MKHYSLTLPLSPDHGGEGQGEGEVNDLGGCEIWR